ncbi:P-type conjugative transfer protein TrbL [Legionella geestiana]|nr:P-type conjugative transfer protein TrbL [Legionella geestiana]
MKKAMIAGMLLMLAPLAHAGVDSADLFDSILSRFESTASGWAGRMSAYASWLFWGLALISMVWTYGMMLLRRADIQEFFAETLRFFTVLGFFYWLVENGPAIAIAVIDSLREIAANASGLNRRVSPSGIVDIGFEIFSRVVDASSIWSPAATTVGLLMGGIILVVLALVGVNMLMVLISAWFIVYGGVFLLGFGGGRWTQEIAIQYYKTVLGIGLQCFAMMLLIGVGRSFIDQYYAAMSADVLLKELAVMLVVAIILLALINKIPPMFSSMVSSGFHGGSGVGLGTAMAAGGMAAGALQMGMQAASGGVVHLAGGASALQEAYRAAQGSLTDTGSRGLGGAFATTAQFTQSMGLHLAQGVSQTLQSKMESAREGVSARVSETFGGQVAEAIRAEVAPENTLSGSPDSAAEAERFHHNHPQEA